MGQKIAPEMLNAIEACRNGMTVPAAAREFCVNPPSLRVHLKRIGIAPSLATKSRPLDAKLVATGVKLRKQAVSIKDIATRLNVAYYTAWHYFGDIEPESAGANELRAYRSKFGGVV